MNDERNPRRSRRESVDAAAAEWLVRHDRGLTPRQQDEFLSWLAASAAHRASFQRHRQMWTEFNALARWRPEHSAEPNPDLLAFPRRRRLLRWIAPALLAAAAGLAMVFWRSPPVPPATETLVFEAANYRQEALPDQSTMDLNRGAHAVVQFSATERRVLLVQGEAQFNVARSARPFVVRAGGVDVRAIGTVFNVKLSGPTVEVLVTQGVVQVVQEPAFRPAAAEAGSAVRAAPAVLAEMSAGQRATIAVAAAVAPPQVIPASDQEIERLLEWKPRLLDFESTPLAEVVDTFNRRNGAQLVLADDALRELPIVASIRSDNVEGFVRLLEATMAVRAERRRNGEIVLRQAR
jgi:transmembrane sensor